MLALGLANVGSGFLGGLACGGSLSQTAVNDGAGARSEFSSIVAAVLSLVTVVALTPLFTDLPEAVLAALIIHAVSHLMKVREMRRYYRLLPREFWLGMITLGGVVILDVLPGLIIGVVCCMVLLIYRGSRIPLSVLGADPEQSEGYVDVKRHPDAQPVPGVLVVRPDGPVVYLNAQSVQDQVETLATDTIHTVIIDLDANDGLDVTACEKVGKLISTLESRHVRVGIAHMHAPTRENGDSIRALERVVPVAHL